MINIEEFLNTEEFKSKQELADETGLSERCVRQKISELKLIKPVIYNSNTKGYRLAKNFIELNPDEFRKEIELINHCINDIQARNKVFNNQLRSYIAYKKAAEVYYKFVQ